MNPAEPLNTTLKREIILVLLDDFADWEGAFIAPCLNQGVAPGRPTRYTVKTMSPTEGPLTSIGGMKVIPDYTLDTLPAEYAGLILVGGSRWFSPDAELLVPLLANAVRNGKLVAGICNASVFLGMHGHLNDIRHTSNTLAYLKSCAGNNYTGDAHYIEAQATRDGNIVTANGTAHLEFCREILLALKADTPEKIEENYLFYKNGFCPVAKD